MSIFQAYQEELEEAQHPNPNCMSTGPPEKDTKRKEGHPNNEGKKSVFEPLASHSIQLLVKSQRTQTMVEMEGR